LVDKAKTKLVIKPKMDGDEQIHCLNIWENPFSMKLLIGGSFNKKISVPADSEKAKRKMMTYH
jgi:hypothetical protein